MSNIADEVRKAGDPRTTEEQAVVAGDAALKKLGDHRKKMKLPVDESLDGLRRHLSSSKAVNVDGGFAELEKLDIRGKLQSNKDAKGRGTIRI
ncbi:hypothetical protein DBR42_14875 [Pelomonas sp. HMWF004]|nr:hypothetical protein DBR42_14875 [Pelomonas sp. HMWF004]